VLLLIWAPYCGCALDLPVWQRVRAELHVKGLEIVTIGMDTTGAEGCRPYIEAAAPEHPALIDADHEMAALFGVVNIPTGIWIDEEGMLVRPPLPAYAPETQASAALTQGLAGVEMPSQVKDLQVEASQIPQYRAEYRNALWDWVERGPESRYAMTPDAVVSSSAERGSDTAQAAAHFELAQHLWRAHRLDGAYKHFREAHRLHPDNLEYKRQAWSLVSWTGTPYDRFVQAPLDGKEEEWPFEGDMLTELRRIGPENFYGQSGL
jgi:hypothetical protein